MIESGRLLLSIDFLNENEKKVFQHVILHYAVNYYNNKQIENQSFYFDDPLEKKIAITESKYLLIQLLLRVTDCRQREDEVISQNLS